VTWPSKLRDYMAAPEGNQFWRLRTKHGRDKLFADPELLWTESQAYFEATDKRKWWKTEFNGKDAIECHVPTETPYTLTGLFVYLDISKQTWSQYRDRQDFSDVITRIEQIIYTQKIEGASTGAFNANIVARELGLTDKKELDHKGIPETNVTYKVTPEVTPDE